MTRRAVAISVGLVLVAGCTAAKPATSESAAPTQSIAGSAVDSLSVTPTATPSTSTPAAATTPSAAATASAPAPRAAPSVRPDPAAALARFYGQKLAWKPCGDGFSCARAKVPLDYANPRGRQIEIAMIKLPARQQKRRIGSLFINPGGPGGSGIEYARYADGAIPRAVRDRFDIVGFDPRGVGASTPVRCGSGSDLDQWMGVDPSPDDSRELAQFVAAAKAFAAGCQQRSRDILAHIGTRNAARDLDVMRAAVGDTTLTFLGKSYGTYLGALYADMFPTRVRALILDGAVDPTIDGQTLGRVQAQGFEVALTAFLKTCARLTCSFAMKGNARAGFDDVLARIERDPIPAGGGRSVGPDEAFYAVAQALYSKSYWSVLRRAMAEAQRGDASTLLQLYDAYVDRDPDGNYTNMMESYTAISCLDRPAPRALSAYQADAARQAKESPHFGAAAGFSGLPCAYWAVPAVERPAALRARGAAPILVIGTSRDPATPLVWAKALAQQLESGRLLTYDGDGHTVYGDGNSCVDKAGNAYLIDLVMPKDGKRCG